MDDFRVGQGFDVHKLVTDRKLILCGVEIPCPSLASRMVQEGL